MAAQESQANHGGKLVNKLLLYQSLMLLLILKKLKLISIQGKIYCRNFRDKVRRDTPEAPSGACKALYDDIKILLE